MQIIEIPTTPQMVREAVEKANELGRLRNSIRRGKGNEVGFLGELAFNELLNGYGQISNTYDYDILYRSSVKIDVKTKETSVLPQFDYEASVAAFNTRQKCDLYAFGRVRKDHGVFWFCGLYRKDKYFQDSRFLKKGEVDTRNNYVVKADCHNMYYRDMVIPKTLLNNASELGFKIISL